MKPTVNGIGYYTAILTSLLTIITFGIAIFTPPVSGPNCFENCVEYPFTDIVDRFPRDYIWMYPAILLLAVYIMLMAVIYHHSSEETKLFSHMGLIFAQISSAILILDYFVQISVIQPSILNGEMDGISLLTQYNPHGLFIALEDLGYLLMSVAFLCLVPVFSGKAGIERILRWLFSLNFVVTIGALIGFTLSYGVKREYRFEVIALSANWLVLIVGGGLLSHVFRRAMP